MVVWVLHKFILECLVVSLSIDKVEERWVAVKLITGTDDRNVTFEWRLEWKAQWEMSLLDPTSVINDSLAKEAAVLQGNIW